MFKIIKSDGAILAMTEAPNYIRLAENGCFVLCTPDEAQGIAYEGIAYHLIGRPEMEGVEPVMLEAADSGKYLLETRQAMSDTDAMNVDQEYRLTMLELGITDARGEL